MLQKGLIIISTSVLFFSTLTTEANYANYYLVCASLSIFVAISALCFLTKKITFEISLVDLLLPILSLYTLVQHYFYNINSSNVTLYKSLFLYSVTFSICRNLFKKQTDFSYIAIIYSLVFVNIWQYCQITIGFVKQKDLLVHIQNTFGNTGSFAIFLSVGFVVCLFSLFDNKFQLFEKVLLVTICLANVLLIIFLRSRTALLIVALFSMYPIMLTFLQNKRIKHRWIITCVAAILVLVVAFSFKVQSSLGRLLIWKVSINMLYNYFPFGSGLNTFPSEYPHFQADYYNQGKMSEKEILLADNTVTAFNEPLQVACELGLVGLCIISFILWKLLKIKNNKHKTIKFATLSLFFASLFYYSFHSTILLLLLLLLSSFLLADNKKPLFTITGYWTKMLFCTILIFAIMAFYTFHLKYIAIKKFTNLQVYNSEIFNEYIALNKHLSDNPVFLYVYANELYKNNKPKDALEKLSLLSRQITWYKSELLIGDSYVKINEQAKAKKYYESAVSICPGKFNARHKLLNFYISNGSHEAAIKTATDIVNLSEKIPSAVTLAIKLEAESYLKTSNNISK